MKNVENNSNKWAKILDFKKEVDENIEMFKKDPCPTYEFSTSGENLSDKMLYLFTVNNELSTSEFDNYSFSIFECETCRGYNPEKPYHVIMINRASNAFKELYSRHYKLQILYKRSHDHNNAPVNVDALKEMIDYIEKTNPDFNNFPLYIELTHAYDTHINDVKAIKFID